MTNPGTYPRFRLAPGTVLRGGRRPPLPGAGGPPAPDPDSASPSGGRPAPDPGTATEPPGDAATPPTGFRNTTQDRAALAVTVDPVWLLAPLFARDAAGLTPPGDDLPGPLDSAIPRLTVTAVDLAAASADWPAWWTAALAFRPGTPAPRQEDLVAGSPDLQRLWAALAAPFGEWLAARPERQPGSDAPARSVERNALAGFTQVNGREPGLWTVRILQVPVTGNYLHSPEPRRIVVSAALRADPTAYAAALAQELPRHF